MQGSDEVKHLAIAAVCGVAVGAVAGAIGYATLSPISSPSRRNSCPSCQERSSPCHSSLFSSAAGGDRSMNSTQDPSRLLEELGKKMDTLEKAVRSRLLSRSGTNSSIAGYLTATESPSITDDDDDFQDVEADSGSEDIFFHSSTSFKRPKASQESSLSQGQGNTIISSDSNLTVTSSRSVTRETGVNYVEIDRCLCSDLTEDNSKAYEQLTSLLEQDASLESNCQFLWRYAKAVHQKNLVSADAEAKKVYAFRARELAFKALECPGGLDSGDVHKWCAITIGNMESYVSIPEKIANGSVFKERIDSAIRLNNRDEMSFYLLGRWCYSVYMMTWVERRVATSIVSNFPSATIDEALDAFRNSESIKPGHWIDNQLYLAKCYVEKKDYASAMVWLDKANELDYKSEDKASKDEVLKLISKYSSYRQS